MKLQIAGFLDNSLVNGTGFRSVVFVSGCHHNCDECQNKDMQDFNYGDCLDTDDIFKRIKNNMPIIKGVTFSGGEPFEQAQALSLLACKLKKENLNLWCYTGYTFEEILNNGDKNKISFLKDIDVLIDGKFDKNLRKNAPKYAGSSNQRKIDVKESLNCGSVICIK